MTRTPDAIDRLLSDEHDAITLRRVITIRWRQRRGGLELLEDAELVGPDDFRSLAELSPGFFDDLLHDLGLPRHKVMRQILVEALDAHHSSACR